MLCCRGGGDRAGPTRGLVTGPGMSDEAVKVYKGSVCQYSNLQNETYDCNVACTVTR